MSALHLVLISADASEVAAAVSVCFVGLDDAIA